MARAMLESRARLAGRLAASQPDLQDELLACLRRDFHARQGKIALLEWLLAVFGRHGAAGELYDAALDRGLRMLLEALGPGDRTLIG